MHENGTYTKTCADPGECKKKENRNERIQFSLAVNCDSHESDCEAVVIRTSCLLLTNCCCRRWLWWRVSKKLAKMHGICNFETSGRDYVMF